MGRLPRRSRKAGDRSVVAPRLGTLSPRDRREVLAFAGGVRAAAHYAAGVIVDEEGQSHRRGGETANPERAAYGYTEAEVEALWVEMTSPPLGPRGGKPRATIAEIDAWEGVLCEALTWLDEGRTSAGGAERQRRYRERMRSWGFCASGCGRPASDGRTKCADCAAKTAAYVAAGRERKRAQRTLA